MRSLAATLVSLVVLLALAGCGGDDEATAPTTTVSNPGTTTQEAAPTTTEAPATTEEQAGPTVVIETAGGPVEIQVEVADTQEAREVGLMNRESLPADAGMIFLFDEDSVGGFWMKDTLIPLSIAFANADGEILSILDMEPCEADPCEIYDPGVPYRSALEVNKGAFDGWGVQVGDVLSLTT